tara:strand:+ start:4798 stop:5628 length:831 start_codon:yes stop_codon:yes gene_type:complete
MNYYDILGVNQQASPDDLKKAYKKASMQHHPDRGGDESKFKEINEAYSTLKDPQKRQQYDNPQRQFNHQNFRNGGGNGAFDINDIMSQFGFGGNMGPGARQQMRNQDITIGCNITIEEVFSGKNIIANYRLNNGREQTVDIQIPQGVRQNDKIRYAGMGQHDIQQIPPGDLYVQILIQGTNEYEVNGLDLITTRRINTLKLITGCVIKITIPGNSSVNLNIPGGTGPTTTLKITGKGLLNRAGNSGNVLVKIVGQTPSGLAQEDLNTIGLIGEKYS